MALRYDYVHGCVRALLNHCDYARVPHRRRRDYDQGSTDHFTDRIGLVRRSLTMAVHLAASLK